MDIEKIIKLVSRHYVLCIFLLLVVPAELLFDVAEITIGQIMKRTNSLRPKIGRTWVEEEKDLAGKEQVTSIVDSLSRHPFRVDPIDNLEDLLAYLTYKNQILLSRTDFINLYQAFVDSQARQLVDPLLLEDLSQNSTWQSTSLRYEDGKMALIFADAYGQPLLVTHPAAPGSRAPADTLARSLLAEDPRFAARLIEPQPFLKAFAQLPRRLQLQLMNSPGLAALPSQEWVMVGIGSTVQNGSILFACEIKQDHGSQVLLFQASELAVAYLIRSLKEVDLQGLELSMPEKESPP